MGRPKKSAPVLHDPEEDFSQDVPDEEPARVIDEDEADEPEPATNGSISKAQAVRNALAEGLEKPGEIADFARKHYGLEITNQQVSAYKAQTKARARKEDGPEEPTTSTDEDDQTGGSKTDLIRAALEAGYEKPALGVDHIKKKYGVDIDAKYYSIIKGKLGKSDEKPTEAPVAATPAPRAANATTPARTNGILPPSLFDDLKQLRQMKDRYGDEFEKLVDAIG